MSRKLFLALLVTAFVISAGCSISGTVRKDGAGLEGANVKLTGAASRNTTTDTDGEYNFASLRNGTYRVTPSKDCYTFDPVTREVVIQNESESGVDFDGIYDSAICEPPLDTSLSPPIVGKPIYNCAEIIYYHGADRDSKIRVYVNGAMVKEISSWRGRGTVVLPSVLSTGDMVSAAQIVGGHISAKTREPVRVENLPPDKLINGERLITPSISPPLYECQRSILVEKVVQGATVYLGENDVEIKHGMTPYIIIWFGMPELKVDDRYDAWQTICAKLGGYPSLHSQEEKVEKKPETLPTPEIHEPIVAGSDACQVDNLFFGAIVKIFAIDGTTESEVGGGTALASSTIYYVNPPLNPDHKYYAVQYLCELSSDPSETTTPVREVPAPVIEEPICKGAIYVTVCNTIPLSTVKVYLDGTQVAQAAGNGGCVKIALGDATVADTGQKLTAKQFVFANESPESAMVTVKPSGAPPYEPDYWNDPDYQHCNNCYNYGCDIRTDTYAQPGHASGVSHDVDCPSVGSAAQADGLAPTNIDKKCGGCTHLVALVIDPDYPDYHWYRLDDTGRWSHKTGPLPASDRDASNNLITSPETADRDYSAEYDLNYKIFCGYYCVNKDYVTISGSRSCY